MKRVKKNAVTSILAVCLAFIMAFSTGMTAAAEGGDLTSGSTGTITISGIETVKTDNPEIEKGVGKLYAYKVIDVNVNDTSNQPQSPVYTWADGVADWVEDAFEGYIDTENGNAVTDAFLNLDDNDEEIKDFVDQLANTIRKTGSTITLTPASYELSTYSPVGDSKAITLENIPLGAYLFLVEGGVRIYSPGFASVYPAYDEETDKWVPSGQSINVYIKSEEPDIEKSVEDYTYAIGQTVNYTLVVDVPDYPENAVDKKFIIADYLSEGLTFNEGSVEIYNYDGNAVNDNYKGNVITESFEAYTFTEENDHPAEGIAPSFARSFIGNYSSLAEKVIVEYSATVNEKAVVKESADSDNKLDNKAYLIYNNNPYTKDGYREIPDEERVYTYGIQVTKTDNSDKKLLGAEFNLKQGEETLKFVKDGNVYRLPLAAEITDDNVTKTTTLVTDSSGIIMIKGLDLGTYTLVETKAPDGYELPADPETVITLADDKDNSGASAAPDGILNNDSNGTVETTVVNTKPGIIPVTGGVGTALFTIFGLLLMSGAVILVVTVSRRKSH